MYYSYGDWCTPPPYPITNQSLTSASSYALDVLHLSMDWLVLWESPLINKNI